MAGITADADGEHYQPGFGNEFVSEAVPGALPAGRNSPQRAPLGLYAEQLSGTAFTQPRAVNRRTWVYRIMPSAAHPRFDRIGNGSLARRTVRRDRARPQPASLGPAAAARRPGGFRRRPLHGRRERGPAHPQRDGRAPVRGHLRSMTDRYFVDADGELLFVPQHGTLVLHTELGRCS